MSCFVLQDRPRPSIASGTALLQRECAACGSHKSGAKCPTCDAGSDRLARTVSPQLELSADAQQAPPIVHEVLRAPGQPLDASTRAFFEPRFRHDFSGVRVHTDARAAESAFAVAADAYTVGNRIVFAAGRWAGANNNGLLAHELAHVVQQSGSAPTSDASLNISNSQDAAEIDADVTARRALAGGPVRPRERTEAGLFRQKEGNPGAGLRAVPTYAASVTPRPAIDGAATSLSWISFFSPAALGKWDMPPPSVISSAFATGSSGFRFSNHLHAWAKSADGIHIRESGFHADSGLYQSPSFLDIPSQGYSPAPIKKATIESGIEAVQFDQIVGARTVSAGIIGGAVGEMVGGGIGSILDRPNSEDDGFWGGIGKKLGGKIGTATANRLTNFPPIWTGIRLILKANGERKCELLGTSIFPSVTFYCDFLRVSGKSAHGTEQGMWERFGWGGGNPWGESRPTSEP